MPFSFRTSRSGKSGLLFGALALVVACSSKDINFYEGSDDGAMTGGSAGTETGGSSSGGSASGSSGTSSVTGGSSGDASGGTDPMGGTAGDTGGTDSPGGTGAGAGMGGIATTGGDGGKGGTLGGGMGGVNGGSSPGGMGGGGAGAGGAGAGGAGAGGAGAGGAGAGGAGAGGAGAGGAGSGGSAGCTPTVPSTERCDGIDNNCAGGVDEGNACPDNCTGATRAGHTYVFCSFESAMAGTRNRNWQLASDFCTMRNLALISVDSAEENAFVRDWITRLGLMDQVWMGANDRDAGLSNREGTWVWGTGNNAVQFWQGNENGNPVMNRYNDWSDIEPNNQGNEDCAVWAADHAYEWDDRICTNAYPNFVCESTVASSGP